MDDCSHFSRQTSNHFGLFSNVQRFSILSNDLFCSHLLQNCTIILSYTIMCNFHIHSMNFVHCALGFHGTFKSFLFHSHFPEGALSVSFTSLSFDPLFLQSLSLSLFLVSLPSLSFPSLISLIIYSHLMVDCKE